MLQQVHMVVVGWSHLLHLQVYSLLSMRGLGTREMICRLSIGSLLQVDTLVDDQRAIQIIPCIL